MFSPICGVAGLKKKRENQKLENERYTIILIIYNIIFHSYKHINKKYKNKIIK